MGLCYSLRSRLAAAHPSAPYGGRGGEADVAPPSAAAGGEHGDPQARHRLRQDLVAKERADKKRSKSIDKTLKAEKREYKQTHRLLLLAVVGTEVQAIRVARKADNLLKSGSAISVRLLRDAQA